jgi:outer membrane protein assembly factor BamB
VANTRHYRSSLLMASRREAIEKSLLFIGIKGTVLALDRNTGDEVWRTSVKGTDFVNLVLDEDNLYATARGEIFCLNPVNGDIRWHNKLSGLGFGLVTIASSGQLVALAEKRRRDQAAAAAAGGAAS